MISPLKDWTCAECGGSGDLLLMEGPGPIRPRCADRHHLAFLPAGNTALTRRAKKASTLSAVVVRFARARKRYERQGILVEHEALEAAEQSCLADEEVRARRRERDAERRLEHDERLTEGSPRGPRSGGCSPAARRHVPVPSPPGPACGAADGWGVPPQAGPWTRPRSNLPSPHPCVTRTPTTTPF